MTTTISLPATSTEQRQLLLELLATRAYRHGNFTLAVILDNGELPD